MRTDLGRTFNADFVIRKEYLLRHRILEVLDEYDWRHNASMDRSMNAVVISNKIGVELSVVLRQLDYLVEINHLHRTGSIDEGYFVCVTHEGKKAFARHVHRTEGFQEATGPWTLVIAVIALIVSILVAIFK